VTAPAALRLASAGEAIDQLYAADAWRAGDLGVPARRGRDRVTFSGIEPAWLREALKRWARQRLAGGCSFNTVTTAMTAMRRFSLFLGECTPQVVAPGQISRPLIEQYLAWVTTRPLADASKNVARLFVRAFLNDNKRYGWLPIPAEAVIYLDELSSHKRPLPRFLPEFVMGQLESEAGLARLAVPYRHLVVLITETGLRAGDASTLPSDTLITDSSGWPCLRVLISKMGAEHLVPLSARAADAVRAQQASLPDGAAWLFPSASDPRLPVAYSTLRGVFNAWQEHIGLHDEAGRPVHVTLHQLRHTFGTRLKMGGVASGASFPGGRDHGAVREREPGSPGPAAGRQSETAGQAGRDITMLQRLPRCRVQFGCIARQNAAATATPKPHQRGLALPKARSSR